MKSKRDIIPQKWCRTASLLLFLPIFALSENPASPKIQSFDLIPTASILLKNKNNSDSDKKFNLRRLGGGTSLEEDEEYRRILTNHHPHTAGVYATLQKLPDEVGDEIAKKHNHLVHEFNEHRSLSRFELGYRGLQYQLEPTGNYDLSQTEEGENSDPNQFPFPTPPRGAGVIGKGLPQPPTHYFEESQIETEEESTVEEFDDALGPPADYDESQMEEGDEDTFPTNPQDPNYIIHMGDESLFDAEIPPPGEEGDEEDGIVEHPLADTVNEDPTVAGPMNEPEIPPPGEEGDEEDELEDVNEESMSSDPFIDMEEGEQQQEEEDFNDDELVDGPAIMPEEEQMGHNNVPPDFDHIEGNGDDATAESIMLEESAKTGGFFNSYQTAPLEQGYGTHYAIVWVGTPPQRKSVIVDTGSHYTAFPCKGCENCGEEHHTDLYFDPTKSSTFRQLECAECIGARCEDSRCVFTQSYTEGSSWQAFQAIDQFFCGAAELTGGSNPTDLSFAIPFMFGCQTSETGLFVTQLADGIMGMSAHDATLPKQMYNKGKLEHNLFTLCFRRELSVSKQGVSAGVMTLGGIDTRLDSSPMVYAKNVASTGWYTVFVKNIFVRSNGGQSARADDELEQVVMKIPVDISSMNGGKGVIVDSGTTDTYLHKDLAKSFGEVWYEVTKRSYSNTGIKLSRDELLRLPTVLIQLRAYDEFPDPSIPPESTTGLVGPKLDPSSPHDVLLAIPATHYMEYSPSKDLYTSRLYFTESRGGVIGANAMQGHDVLFDWENGRVGFAESSCEFKEGENMIDPITGKVIDAGEVGENRNCVLGRPSLTYECRESVTVDDCLDDPNKNVAGFEKWTSVVLSSGTSSGMSCEDALMNNWAEEEKPEVSCDGSGLCFELRPCEVSCAEVMTGESGKAPLTPASPTEGGDICEDGLWGACDHTCEQSKIASTLMSDGLCHEVDELRQTRDCHIDACGRLDPCRVPFVVHAIIALRGGKAPLWNRRAEEVLADALAKTVDSEEADPGNEVLFGAGDVKVLLATSWYKSDLVGAEGVGEEDEEIGMKIVVEISIFNANAKFPEIVDVEQEEEEEEENMLSMEEEDADSNTTFLEKFDKVEGKVEEKVLEGKVKKVVKELPHGHPLSTCEESDFYPLAKTALDVHAELGREYFLSDMISNMKKYEILEVAYSEKSPFSDILANNELARESQVITSWTIKTDVGGGKVHDHSWDSNFRKFFDKDNILNYVTNIPLMTMALALSLILCAIGLCCGCSCGRRKRSGRNQERVALIAEKKKGKKGKYAKISSTGSFDEGEELGLESSSEYKDNIDSSEGDVEMMGEC